MHKLLTFAIASFVLAPTVWAGTPSCDDAEQGICTNYVNLPNEFVAPSKDSCLNAAQGRWSESPCKQKGPACVHGIYEQIYYKDASSIETICRMLDGKVIQK